LHGLGVHALEEIEVRARAVDAEEADGDAGIATAVVTRRIRSSREIPYALSFPSETGDSITAA
jgi:hypothetical protein